MKPLHHLTSSYPIFIGWFTAGLIMSAAPTALAQTPISAINASPLFAPSSSISTIGANSTSYPNTNSYNLNFGFPSAINKNLIMNSIRIGATTYPVQQISNQIGIRRRVFSNSEVTSDRHIMLYERASKTGSNPTNINLAASFVNTMEEILLSNVINRGADNVFANTGDSAGNNNNIERIDMLTTFGLKAPSTVPRLSQVGFMVLDRNGNDKFKIAAIKAIDSANNPTQLGPLVSINSTSAFWGPSGYSVNTTVIRRDGSGLFQPSFDPTNQSIAGTFISYAALGVGVNETIYGYALFPADVNDTSMDLINLTNVPSLTNATDGGLDLLAGGLSFAEYPTTDLAITKTDGQTSATPGSPITYTITVTNNGSTALSSLKVQDTLPSALLTPVFTPSTGTYNSSTSDWTGLSLSPGGTIQLQVSGTIDPNFSGVLTNTAEVLPPDGTEDFNASNDRATDTTTVVIPNPRLRLVKRLTATRGIILNNYIDLVTTFQAADDNLTAWGNLTATAQRSDGSGPTSGFSSFLRGAIDTTDLSPTQQPQPGDILEYTIYFLSDGGKDAQNAMLCDFIPANTTYVRNSLQVAFGSNPAVLVSDLQDTDGGFYEIADVPPSNICQATNHNRGAVQVNLGTVPKSLGSGIPNNSHGFFRFQVKVD